MAIVVLSALFGACSSESGLFGTQAASSASATSAAVGAGGSTGGATAHTGGSTMGTGGASTGGSSAAGAGMGGTSDGSGGSGGGGYTPPVCNPPCGGNTPYCCDEDDDGVGTCTVNMKMIRSCRRFRAPPARSTVSAQVR